MNDLRTTLNYTVIPTVHGPVVKIDEVNHYQPQIEVHINGRFSYRQRFDIQMPRAEAMAWAEKLAKEEIEKIQTRWKLFEDQFNSQPPETNRFTGVIKE